MTGQEISTAPPGEDTVFELTASADGRWNDNAKFLHTFTTGKGGTSPFAGVAFDAAGNLYGTTLGRGALWRWCCLQACAQRERQMERNGAARFRRPTRAQPYAGVIFDAAGNLYGTTAGDGKTTFDSVFEITP